MSFTFSGVPSPRIHWGFLTFFVLMSLATFVFTPLYIYFYGIHSVEIILFAALYVVGTLSITAGYHRLFSHRTYKAAWPLRLFYVIASIFYVAKPILSWCESHRRHHRFVDDVEKDPYPITAGFWYAHWGWMFDKKQEKPLDERYTKDLVADPLVVWQDKHYFMLVLLFNFVLPLMLGIAIGRPVGTLLILGAARVTIGHHVMWCINSLAHVWGRQPYNLGNTARDSLLYAIPSMGEGYHNFHHRFEYDYRNGYNWYDIDASKWFIWTMSKLGLAYDLKRVPAWRVESAKAQVKMQKLQNKVAPDMWKQLEDSLKARKEGFIHALRAREEALEEWRANMLEKKPHVEQTLKELSHKLEELKNRYKKAQLEWRLALQDARRFAAGAAATA